MRKGQAALEFLSTYGWAFLVILVMIGALAYFGVLSPQRFIAERCFLGTEYLCDKDTSVAYNNSGDNNIVIQITHKGDKTITVDTSDAGDLSSDDISCTGSTFTTATFRKNDKANLTFTGCGGSGWKAGEKINADFLFKYSVDGFDKAAPGNIVLTITS